MSDEGRTTLTIKLDKWLRDEALAVANAIGIPLATLIQAYLREIVSSGKVQFSATKNPPLQMKKVMQEARNEMPRKDPEGFVGPMTEEQAKEYMRLLLGE